MQAAPPRTTPRPNLRTSDVMAEVQKQVEHHYRSELVERIRGSGGRLVCGATTIHLAREFGFCYGVERAIDLAYAACKVFAGRRIFLLGEIIHNPDVNAQMAALGIRRLSARPTAEEFEALTSEDVVIVPAFGSEVSTVERLQAVGCQIVDTTCGDVMSVWKRVRQNSKEQVTSIIHGKASHEETRATASRALGPTGLGHYLIVLDLEQARKLRDFIVNGGDAAVFFREFEGAHSPGFDPLRHLQRIGVANQTTMLRSETEAIQNLLREAICKRDGGSDENFRYFDTICGATQDRQDALFQMLELPLDVLLVIGGYNSSNTTHLVEIGSQKVPTFFIQGAHCLLSPRQIFHFEIGSRQEVESADWLPPVSIPASVGITAGASCPNNLIEDVIRRVLELRGEPVP